EEALALGESMAELQRVSPPLWGLAETAQLTGDLEAALSLCRKGLQLSEEVEDAAYLFPFVVTGTRTLLSLGDLDAAIEWIGRCRACGVAGAGYRVPAVAGGGRGSASY